MFDRLAEPCRARARERERDRKRERERECVCERERERAVVALFEPICAAHIGSLGALIALEFEL
jgi:hypothetical protein